MIKNCLVTVGLFVAFTSNAFAQDPDKNWVALNIFDSFYPMTAEQTFPEALASIEIIYQLYSKRMLGRDLLKAMGGLKHGDHQGDRSREGHFTIWIHLSDEFLATHTVDRNDLGSQIFMFPDRQSDIFTGWGGSVNLAAFLTQGVQGLAEPVVANGNKGGSFGNFMNDIVPLGDADYEGGWFMTDAQAEKILTAFKTYPGITQGYSFMTKESDRPNPGYDPPNAQLVNGYNCGDFAFYALNTAGVVSKEESESLKVQFWYPKYYYDHPLPLQGVGASGAAWLNANPGQTGIPDSVMDNLAWPELLFGWTGLEFFNKQQLVQDIMDNQYPVVPARIWDQAHPIAWLKELNEFPSKGIWTELLPAVLSGAKITSPVRTVSPTWWNRFIMSPAHAMFEAQGDTFQSRKYNKAGLSGQDGDEFRQIYESLKTPL